MARSSPTPGRDASGRQFSRKAGDTLGEAAAFKRRIDDQLALGTYRPASTMTFGTHASAWIKTWPMKEQTREHYRGILRRELMPVFSGYPVAKIHPHQVRAWVHEQNAGPLSASSVRQHVAVLRSCQKARADRRAPRRAAAARGQVAAQLLPPAGGPHPDRFVRDDRRRPGGLAVRDRDRPVHRAAPGRAARPDRRGRRPARPAHQRPCHPHRGQRPHPAPATRGAQEPRRHSVRG